MPPELTEKSSTEVVTGFLAILELAKLKRVKLEQKKQFAEIIVIKNDGDLTEYDEYSNTVKAIAREI